MTEFCFLALWFVVLARIRRTGEGGHDPGWVGQQLSRWSTWTDVHPRAVCACVRVLCVQRAVCVVRQTERDTRERREMKRERETRDERCEN